VNAKRNERAKPNFFMTYLQQKFQGRAAAFVVACKRPKSAETLFVKHGLNPEIVSSPIPPVGIADG
jgi:hypothetical protein